MDDKTSEINFRELGFKCDCYPPKAGQRRFFCIWVYYSDKAYVTMHFFCGDLISIDSRPVASPSSTLTDHVQ